MSEVTAKPVDRRGRPRLQDGCALSEVMAFAVTVDESNALYADARRLGYQSVSKYLRVKLGLDKRKH